MLLRTIELPILYKSRNWTSSSSYRYEDVTFLQDWGPFKKDQMVLYLEVDFDEDEVTQYDESQRVVDYVPFKLVPLFEQAPRVKKLGGFARLIY
jgi:hypothetical protein